MAPVYQFVERTYVMLMYIVGREGGNSVQARSGLAFPRKVGITAGVFPLTMWVGLTEAVLQYEDLEEIIAQIRRDTNINILESRPHLTFTNYMSQLDREWQVVRRGIVHTSHHRIASGARAEGPMGCPSADESNWTVFTLQVVSSMCVTYQVYTLPRFYFEKQYYFPLLELKNNSSYIKKTKTKKTPKPQSIE